LFLHLGNSKVISGNSIIAILNIEDPISNDLQEIIENAALDKKLINISKKDKKKALVVCDEGIYISPISSNTLYKRAIHYQKEV
jgi:extracellular matrix regulatory protein B